jgi:hypothetical protein
MAQHEDAAALAELKQIRQEYPDAVITEQVLQSIGLAAMALNQPAEAVRALDAYSLTAQRPGLLLLRGEAREKPGKSSMRRPTIRPSTRALLSANKRAKRR